MVRYGRAGRRADPVRYGHIDMILALIGLAIAVIIAVILDL